MTIKENQVWSGTIKDKRGTWILIKGNQVWIKDTKNQG